ncbi:uncharacterized protein [Dermacentor albipictus]|uniref:uncharacterized protein n=1 Tax=Dermacentor albipictus TaxID=60249 RepID=UPI0038FCC25D
MQRQIHPVLSKSKRFPQQNSITQHLRQESLGGPIVPPRVGGHQSCEFVETPEPIWTYNSTLAVTFRCKVDVMSICTENVIQFNRTCFVLQHKKTRALEGVFRQDRKDQMFIRMLGGFHTSLRGMSVAPSIAEDEGHDLENTERVALQPSRGWTITAEQLVYVNENNSCAVLELWLPFPGTPL